MKIHSRLYSSVDDSPPSGNYRSFSGNDHFWSLEAANELISVYFPDIFPLFKTVKSKLHELSSKGHLNTLAPPCGRKF